MNNKRNTTNHMQNNSQNERLAVRYLFNDNINSVYTPHYQSEGASGLDLCAVAPAVIKPGERAVIPTGLCIKLPEGYEGQVRPRSGLSRRGIDVAFGTIDSDYRGEIGVNVINNSAEPFEISRGMRIAQLVIQRVTLIDLIPARSLSETLRGGGGFGSTGTSAKPKRRIIDLEMFPDEV